MTIAASSAERPLRKTPSAAFPSAPRAFHNRLVEGSEATARRRQFDARENRNLLESEPSETD
jgi:hypothetical protein